MGVVRAPETARTGTLGVTEVRAEFERMGWGPMPNPDHDVGTDLFVQVRDARGHDLGLILGVQVKSGPSRFKEPSFDENDMLEGWWFRDSDRRHIDSWLAHTVPHVMVLRDLETRISYWAWVQPEAVISTGKGAKIMVPRANVISPEQQDQLVAIAGTQRAPMAWEGSAWRSPALAAEDRLRHALLVPRLVAPHPNLGCEGAVSFEEAVGLVVQARLLDFERYADAADEVPSLDDAIRSADWAWRFVGALGLRVTTDDADPLIDTIADAPGASATAAAAATAAAVLIETLRIEEAIALLDPVIADLDVGPVDHAWLLMQRGRALREVGRLEEARADAEAAQRVRQAAPGDVTATAIAGTADMLLFNTAPLTDRDLPMAITGADTAASWWRTQTSSRGLGAIVERTFRAWGRDSTVTIGGADVANNELFVAGLCASHAADQGAWRRLTTLLGCDTLLRLERTADPKSAHDGLTLLRMAGAVNELAIAVKQLAANGPAEAVTLAAASVRLDRSTRTSARADLALLQHGGHLANTETTRRTADWLLATLDDPTDFIGRTGSAPGLEDQLVVTLAAVIPGADPGTLRRIVDRVLELEPHPKQLTAGSWAKVVRALPPSIWDEAAGVRAAAVAATHHDALRLPLLGIAARYDDEAASRLLEHASTGSLAALISLGDVRVLPRAVAAAVIERLGEAVERIADEARHGKFGIGGYDVGDALALLNAWHPAVARWDALLAFLGDDAVNASSKRRAMRTLATLVDHIPPAVGTRLLPIVARIATRTAPPSRGSVFDEPGDAAGDAANLAVAMGGLDVDDSLDRLFELVAGGRGDRQAAARVARQAGRPEDVGVLIVLAADPDPDVRAGAASGLAALLATGVATPSVRWALERCLEDPGALVPAHIAGTLRSLYGAKCDDLLARLRGHRSAFVREQAFPTT